MLQKNYVVEEEAAGVLDEERALSSHSPPPRPAPTALAALCSAHVVR